LCGLLVAAIEAGWLRSAHDVSEGGLLFALAECIVASPNPVGAVLDLSFAAADPERLLFGEAPSRVVVSVAPDRVAMLDAAASEHGVPLKVLGTVGGRTLRGDPYLAIPVETLLDRHRAPLPGL